MHKFHHTASGLASLGRHGDSMLVHMSPGEVASLQKMAELKGGSLTINPHTGLPEAGFLKDFLPMIAGGIAALFTGGMSLPMQLAIQGGAGMAAGAATGKKGLGELLLSGIGGVGGAGLVGGLSKLGAGAATAANAAAAPGMTSLAATPASSLGGIEGALATDLTAPLATSAAPGALSAATSSAIPTIAADLGGIGASGASSALGAIPSMAEVAAPLATSAYSPVALANSVTPSLSNAGSGLAKILTNSPEAAGFMTANKMPLMMSAAPLLAHKDSAPGEPPVKPTPFYNTTFNRRINPNYGKPGESMYIDSYGPGTWSKDYLYGSNLAPAPGEGQLASDSTLGTFGNPMSGSTPIGMSGGGEVGFALGGQTSPGSASLSDMNNYYRNLMTPKPPAPSAGGADHSAYLSSLAATPFNPNFQMVPTSMDMAGSASRMGLGDATDAAGVTTPNAAGTGMRIFSDYNYGYDPVTQKYTGGRGGFNFANMNNFRFSEGGLADLSNSYAAGGKLLHGPGDGMSDSIPAVIQGHKPQKAALSNGEFVIPADVVSGLGMGSTSAGGDVLYDMVDRVRMARTGRKRQAPAINVDKYLPA